MLPHAVLRDDRRREAAPGSPPRAPRAEARSLRVARNCTGPGVAGGVARGRRSAPPPAPHAVFCLGPPPPPPPPLFARPPAGGRGGPPPATPGSLRAPR